MGMKFPEEIDNIFLHNIPTFLEESEGEPLWPRSFVGSQGKKANLISAFENGLSNLLFSKERVLPDQEEEEAASELSEEYKSACRRQ